MENTEVLPSMPIDETKSMFNRLVTEATVEYATLLFRLNQANDEKGDSTELFKTLKLDVPLANGKVLKVSSEIVSAEVEL